MHKINGHELRIQKGENGYAGYIAGEKNACSIYYLDNDSVAYIHNVPPAPYEGDRLIVEEKIFLVIETVDGEYCDDVTRYKGKGLTRGYGTPIKGQYLVESWLITENGEQFGDPVEVGLLELEIDDTHGENYKKVIEYLAGYAAFHDFEAIYNEREEALAEFLKYKARCGDN